MELKNYNTERENHMRKHIFLCAGYMGNGGGQLYIQKKREYLEAKGQEVYFLSINMDNPIGDNAFTIKCFNVHPTFLFDHQVEKTIADVLKRIDYQNDDDITVESLSLILSMWGEIIAERTKGKNVIFSISERSIISKGEVDFFSFKANRHEFATINRDFIHGLYEHSSIEKKDIAVLRASHGRLVEDVKCPQLESIEFEGISICVFGRLEKQYVSDATEGLIEFCGANPNEQFTIVYIGDSFGSGVENGIRNRFKDIKNVKLHIIGALTPIPKSLFAPFDLFIGGAGCATIPYANNALSIAMDVKDGGYPLGVMGYDVLSSFGPVVENHERFPLHILLGKVLFEGYGKDRKSYVQKSKELYKDYEEFLMASEQNKVYYPYKSIHISRKEWMTDFGIYFIFQDSLTLIHFRRKLRHFFQLFRKNNRKLNVS